jgi:hypothetical protein
MRQTILSLLFLLLAFCVRAQGPSADKTEIGAIQRVKKLLISSLDRSLPKVTLEFFLKYEGEGEPIKWEVNDCAEKAGDSGLGDRRDSAMCVQADIGLKDGRAATVIVSVGTFKRGPVDVPTVHAVRVTYPGGTIHRLDRLGDLPVELHRPLPKGPKDLPAPVSALLSFSSLKPNGTTDNYSNIDI